MQNQIIPITLPESAKLHWGQISLNMDRIDEDIVYIVLDSKMIIDVGCYGAGKYNDSNHPFTLIVVDGRSDIEDVKILAWDNPHEVHEITSELVLAEKITELAQKYSIGGECYPPKDIVLLIEDYCNHCNNMVKYYLHEGIFYCHECGCKELTEQAKRHCPYCIKDTIHIINSPHPYCRECKNERGW